MYTKDDHTKKTGTTNLTTEDTDLQEDFQRVKDKARETRDALAQTAYDVKDKATDVFTKTVRDAKAKTDDIQENVIVYVRANPVKAMGWALLTGAVTALLLRR
jgi:ElaB/YqjD/DUF883 family membrane-anchored ribosome-binding protein